MSRIDKQNIASIPDIIWALKYHNWVPVQLESPLNGAQSTEKTIKNI